MDDLCAELRKGRESLGLSIDDVYRKTRINPELLVALESGRFEVLPETYVRLFLKKYAQEVRLDPDEAIKAYDLIAMKRARESEPQVAVPPLRPRQGSGRTVGAAAALVVIAAGIYLLIRQDPSPPQPEPVARRPATDLVASVRGPQPPAPASTPVPEQTRPEATAPAPRPEASATSPELFADNAPEPETGEAPEETPSGEVFVEETTPRAVASNDAELAQPSAPEKEPAKDRVVAAFSLSPETIFGPTDTTITLTVRGLDNTVVTVTADDALLYQGPILAGRRTSWTARDRFRFEVQSGAAVQISLQESQLRPLGAHGERVRLFVSRSSIWVEEIQPAGSAGASR